MIGDSFDYFVRLRAIAHIDHRLPEVPSNESVTFEVVFVNSTQQLSELCRVPVYYGDITDDEIKWYYIGQISLSSYCLAYVTTETLKDVMVDSFGLKEVHKRDDIDYDDIVSRKKGLSGGEVARTVIGIFIVVCFIAVLVIYLVRIRIRYGDGSDAIIKTSI